MKAIRTLLVILSIAMFATCGSSTPKTDVHTHDEGCEHNHYTDSHSSAHHQESFTVEVDSTHNHKVHEEKAHHEHKHADGKTHKH